MIVVVDVKERSSSETVLFLTLLSLILCRRWLGLIFSLFSAIFLFGSS